MAPGRGPLLDATRFELGNGIELRLVKAADLQEQDINAQVMAPADFERLTDNIRKRGALESLPYCSQPGGEGRVEIVSGHHRVRAGVAAGLETIWVMVDTAPLTRSQIVAKQIAHNQLVGRQDEAILRELIGRIDDVEDLLETGLPPDYLPTVPDAPTLIGTPHADFEWRTMTFTFLPHQLDDFSALVEQVSGADVLGAAPLESFEPFVRAVSAYQREKHVISIGTTIALLTRLALEQVEEAEHEHGTDQTQPASPDRLGPGEQDGAAPPGRRGQRRGSPGPQQPEAGGRPPHAGAGPAH